MELLIEKSLPDAGHVAGIDPRKPILLGFSAGGQAALILWSSKPARLGGLIVDAAYPIRLEADPKTGHAGRRYLARPILRRSNRCRSTCWWANRTRAAGAGNLAGGASVAESGRALDDPRRLGKGHQWRLAPRKPTLWRRG